MATAPICLQDDDGQILKAIRSRPVWTIRASGPSIPGCTKLAVRNYVSITDKEALEAFQLCCATEGIIPALEPSHALAHVMKIAPELPKDHLICMNMCGRGDKDVQTVAKYLNFDMSDTEGRTAD